MNWDLLLDNLSIQSSSSSIKGAMMKKMPASFAGHGSPMNVLDEGNPFNQDLSLIVQKPTKSKAILMISVYWHSNRLQVMLGEYPRMTYDFYGFSEELSRVQCSVPGSPESTKQVWSLLQLENVELNPIHGFDYGIWMVLKFLYPDADIPVVQPNLNRLQSTEWHFELARKPPALREQGVLIIGSGNIVHNLRVMNWEHIDQIGAGYGWAYAPRDQINHAVIMQNNNELVHYEQSGENAAPSIPTSDHCSPLLYVIAPREHDERMGFFNDSPITGSLSMTSVSVNQNEHNALYRNQ